MLTVLTPTGGRFDAINNLGHYIRSQTYTGPVRWLFVDDVDPATEIPEVPANWTVEVIRPAPRWRGGNTQARNLKSALDAVSDDERIVILEDDDWISPGYLSVVSERLERHDLAGERPVPYYNVSTRRWYRSDKQKDCAPLCATAMKGGAVETFRRVVTRHKTMIDTMLWGEFAGNKAIYPGEHVVGIKGMPGRAGVGCGHKPRFGTPDDGSKLREMIGDAADFYP